jgi:hypothetical protein
VTVPLPESNTPPPSPASSYTDDWGPEPTEEELAAVDNWDEGEGIIS